MSAQCGRRIVEMVWEDLKIRDLLTPDAFDNAAVTLMANGGSTNAIVHLVAMAGRAGVATLMATTAAGQQHYDLVDVPLAQAYAVMARISPDLVSEFA